MKVLAYLLALLSPSSGIYLNFTANTPNQASGCNEPDDAFLQLSAQLALEEEQEYANGTELYKRDLVTIPTYFHVIAASKQLEDGWVSADSIIQLLEVINSAFRPHNFAFSLGGISRTVDRDLAIIEDGSYNSHKRKSDRLRKGDINTLNIYTVKRLPRNLAGVCSLPSSQRDSLVGDGCRVNFDTLPPFSNGGKTAVHEIGHWLGLMHTFQEDGGCRDGFGDDVSDTPVHLVTRGGCDERNTCPEFEGMDPVNNHMNYADAHCRTEFTAGQARRMHYWYERRQRQRQGEVR